MSSLKIELQNALSGLVRPEDIFESHGVTIVHCFSPSWTQTEAKSRELLAKVANLLDEKGYNWGRVRGREIHFCEIELE